MPPSGLTCVRWLKSVAVGGGDMKAVQGYVAANSQWADQAVIKAAVGATETSTIGGGANFKADFMAAVRAESVIGKLPLRRLPPRLPMLTATDGATAYWVKDGRARPVSIGQYVRDPVGLSTLTVAALTVASEELIRDKTFEAEAELRADLLAACREEIDATFLDLANPGVAEQKPASVTAGATPIVSSGATIAALVADMSAAIALAVAAGARLSTSRWVVPADLAAAMALRRDSADWGLPIVASDAAPSGQITLVDGSQVSYVEDTPELRASRNATIEMSNTPTGDTLTPTAASSSLVSMFQANAVALLAQLSVNWKVRRSGVVQVITGVELS